MHRRAETEIPKVKKSETQKSAGPRYAYEIDFRSGDIRRRMLAALQLAA